MEKLCTNVFARKGPALQKLKLISPADRVSQRNSQKARQTSRSREDGPRLMVRLRFLYKIIIHKRHTWVKTQLEDW